MKMKFGAIVVDGRGKVGGQVASKNRGGAYLRTKVTPVNPRTAAQLGVRSIFTSLSQAWRGLSQAQRDAWNAAVGSFARTNIFGDLKNPSGFNLYQRLNNNLIQVGESAISVPPLPSAVGAYTALELTYAVGVPALSVSFEPSVDLGIALVVRATAPQSAGKSFVKSEFRVIGIIEEGQDSPQNILAMYTAIFGSVGAVGQKIFVELLPINMATGQAGTPSQISAISAA